VVPKLGDGAQRHAFQARTMEFGPDVTGWRLVSVPRGYSYSSCRMNTCGGLGIIGFQWTSKYQRRRGPGRPGLPVLTRSGR
jgi:penicillin V acylase-like amidase (Ntn superfamily)